MYDSITCKYTYLHVFIPQSTEIFMTIPLGVPKFFKCIQNNCWHQLTSMETNSPLIWIIEMTTNFPTIKSTSMGLPDFSKGWHQYSRVYINLQGFTSMTTNFPTKTPLFSFLWPLGLSTLMQSVSSWLVAPSTYGCSTGTYEHIPYWEILCLWSPCTIIFPWIFWHNRFLHSICPPTVLGDSPFLYLVASQTFEVDVECFFLTGGTICIQM